MIRNILFDWSGTLVDDLPAVWSATNHVFRLAGIEPMTLETFRQEFSLPFKNFYDRFTPATPMPQLEVWYHEHFRKAQDDVLPLPHAREFLQVCRDRGIRTFLLSTIHRDHYEAQSKTTGLASFIDRPYIEILDKRLKIRAILEENDLKADETLFIGDMEHDVETARVGGVFSCGVLTGYNTLAQLRQAKPDLLVEHLSELRRELDEYGWDLHKLHEVRPHAKERFPISTVGALIRNDCGEVLMIQTHKWSNMWGIPGGKIQYGETSVDALRREILEETALCVFDIEFAMVQDCIASKEFYREAHFLLLNYTCKVDGASDVTLNHEAQTFRWTSISEALAMPLNQPTRTLIEHLRANTKP